MPKHLMNHPARAQWVNEAADDVYKKWVRPKTEHVPGATTTEFQGQTLYAVAKPGCKGCLGDTDDQICRVLPSCARVNAKGIVWMTADDMAAWTAERLTEGEPHA